MNPARDLGPRLASAVAGFGPAAMQSAWLYTAGPIVGAILGGSPGGVGGGVCSVCVKHAGGKACLAR